MGDVQVDGVTVQVHKELKSLNCLKDESSLMSTFIYMLDKGNKFQDSLDTRTHVKNYSASDLRLSYRDRRIKFCTQVKKMLRKKHLFRHLKKIIFLSIFLFGKKNLPHKNPPMKNILVLELRFPACIFASQISKRSTKTVSFRLTELQETNTSGSSCTAAKQLPLCSVIPQLHCTVK